MNFKEAVKCYRCLLCKRHLDELDRVKSVYLDFTATPSKASLHDLAEVCVVGGHQNRIPFKYKNPAINEIEVHILSILSTSFKDFEDLYDAVDGLIGNLDNIGPLTVYDVSLRIGHLFSEPIYPRKILYLNNGAMEGAKKLLGGRKLSSKEVLSSFFSYPDALAVVGIKSLQALPNNLIEDFFCVMKAYLDSGPRGLITDRDRTPTYIQM